MVKDSHVTSSHTKEKWPWDSAGKGLFFSVIVSAMMMGNQQRGNQPKKEKGSFLQVPFV